MFEKFLRWLYGFSLLMSFSFLIAAYGLIETSFSSSLLCVVCAIGWWKLSSVVK